MTRMHIMTTEAVGTASAATSVNGAAAAARRPARAQGSNRT